MVCLLQLLSDVHLADQLGIEDGTAMGSGMATAANMLKDSDSGSGSGSKLVTLITDGVNNAGQIDPITVATAAETLGIKLYTIGVGTDDPGGPAGATGGSALDEAMLREIANITKREVLHGYGHGGTERTSTPRSTPLRSPRWRSWSSPAMRRFWLGSWLPRWRSCCWSWSSLKRCSGGCPRHP